MPLATQFGVSGASLLALLLMLLGMSMSADISWLGTLDESRQKNTAVYSFY